jgi:hypothetical protein
MALLFYYSIKQQQHSGNWSLPQTISDETSAVLKQVSLVVIVAIEVSQHLIMWSKNLIAFCSTWTRGAFWFAFLPLHNEFRCFVEACGMRTSGFIIL